MPVIGNLSAPILTKVWNVNCFMCQNAEASGKNSGQKKCGLLIRIKRRI